MKELEELPAWWGEGISSSSSSSSSPPSSLLEDGGWKSNMQILLPRRNMKEEWVEQKFDFRREEKYCSANQAALQMVLNKFKTISSAPVIM